MVMHSTTSNCLRIHAGSRNTLFRLDRAQFQTTSRPTYAGKGDAELPKEDRGTDSARGGSAASRLLHWRKVADTVKNEILPTKQHELKNVVRELEREETVRVINSKRLKSYLSASDRHIMNGRRPNIGFRWAFNDHHRSQEFKMSHFGLLGARESGLSPQVCWPSSDEIRMRVEQERTMHDFKPLKQLMADADEARLADLRKKVEREEAVDANRAKMMTAWKQLEDRVKNKDKDRNADQEMRQQILLQLRQEVGYDMDVHSPEFKARFEEKKAAIVNKRKSAKEKRHRNSRADTVRDSTPNDTKSAVDAQSS